VLKKVWPIRAHIKVLAVNVITDEILIYCAMRTKFIFRQLKNLQHEMFRVESNMNFLLR